MVTAANAYLARGWSVIPQQPRTKKACVKWKEFQRPTSNQTAVEGLVEVLPRSRHRRDLWAAKQDSGG